MNMMQMSMTSNEYDVVSRNNPAQYKSTCYVHSVSLPNASFFEFQIIKHLLKIYII